MDRKVRAAIAGFQGTVRLYARNLHTGETYGIGENEKVRTASTSKTAAASPVLQMAEKLPGACLSLK